MFDFTYKSNPADRVGFRRIAADDRLASSRTITYKRSMTPASNENQTDDPMLSAVGQRVQRLREAKGMKPADFARVAGITQQYLWRLEDGQQNLNLRTMSRLALALDVPMAALVEGIDPDPATLEKRPYRKRPLPET